MGLSLENKLWLFLIVVILYCVEVKTSHALTKAEITCGAISVYHEGRSLSPEHWDRLFKVAVNRTKHHKRYHSRSKHLCDIVHSREYVTRNLRRCSDGKLLQTITKRIQKGYWKLAGSYTSFRSRNGVMYYKV